MLLMAFFGVLASKRTMTIFAFKFAFFFLFDMFNLCLFKSRCLDMVALQSETFRWLAYAVGNGVEAKKKCILIKRCLYMPDIYPILRVLLGLSCHSHASKNEACFTRESCKVWLEYNARHATCIDRI